MTENFDDQTQLIKEMIAAANDLPLSARLQIAKNIVLDNGGVIESGERNPILCVAYELVDQVITVLDLKFPEAAKAKDHADDVKIDAEIAARRPEGQQAQSAPGAHPA